MRSKVGDIKCLAARDKWKKYVIQRNLLFVHYQPQRSYNGFSFHPPSNTAPVLQFFSLHPSVTHSAELDFESLTYTYADFDADMFHLD
jgi:hypothetical protein